MASLVERKFKSGSVWYIQYWEGGKQKRERAHESKRIAEQKLRDFETAQAQGDASVALPTRTPIAEVLSGYIEHIRTAKTPKSAQTDIYYLRDVFGSVCEGLTITSRKISARVKKRPPKPGQDRRRKASVVSASHFEVITTAQISKFIAGRMASRGLKPKTGNRIRDTLSSLFSWAMEQRGIRMPGGKNPVSAVAKYKESAPEICFLTRGEIDAQLEALKDDLKMQAMAPVGMNIPFGAAGDLYKAMLVTMTRRVCAVAFVAGWGINSIVAGAGPAPAAAPAAAPATSPATRPTTAPAALGITPGKVGQRVESAGIVVTVVKVAHAPDAKWKDIVHVADDEKFIDLELLLENNTGKDLSAYPSLLKLKDDQDQEYGHDAITGVGQPLSFSPIAQGQKVRGHLSYSVPKSAKGLRLIYALDGVKGYKPIFVELGE